MKLPKSTIKRIKAIRREERRRLQQRREAYKHHKTLNGR